MESFAVGTRVAVRARFYDPETQQRREPISPRLVFLDPEGVQWIETLTRDAEGDWRGSHLVDLAGAWRYRIDTGFPLETARERAFEVEASGFPA